MTFLCARDLSADVLAPKIVQRVPDPLSVRGRGLGTRLILQQRQAFEADHTLATDEKTMVVQLSAVATS